MEKTYEVRVDVVMTGSFYIEASSPEEAEAKAREMSVVSSDLRNFINNGIEVVDVEESED